MGVYKWAKDAFYNYGSDSAINLREGQLAPTLNDSLRGFMASFAKWRDDISGSLVSQGSFPAYVIFTNQVFTSKVVMDGQMLAFRASFTNLAGTTTLQVDALGNVPLTRGDAPVAAGDIVSGRIYSVVYRFDNNTWTLRNFGT